MDAFFRAVEFHHQLLHVLQTSVFSGVLGQRRRAIAMVPALLLLGLSALIGEPGRGFGLLGKAPCPQLLAESQLALSDLSAYSERSPKCHRLFAGAYSFLSY